MWFMNQYLLNNHMRFCRNGQDTVEDARHDVDVAMEAAHIAQNVQFSDYFGLPEGLRDYFGGWGYS